MTASNRWITFYRKAAYMAYAVAAADKHIAEEETATLRKIVREYWLTIENTTDEFGTDAAFQLETVFDWLTEKAPNAELAFKKFQDYVQENRDFLTDDLKMTLIHLSKNIAVAFHGANKSELHMLLRIQELLLNGKESAE